MTEEQLWGNNYLQRTSWSWYLGISPHTVCSVGTSCLPGLDLQLCRKEKKNHHTSLHPGGCAVTAGPDLPVDREGGQGTQSASVCWASATVNTLWASEQSHRETQWWEQDGSGLKPWRAIMCVNYEHVCVYVSAWSKLKLLAFITFGIIPHMCVRDHMRKCFPDNCCAIKAILFPCCGVTKPNEKLAFLITPHPRLTPPSNIPKWELCVRLQHSFCLFAPPPLLPPLSLSFSASICESLSLPHSPEWCWMGLWWNTHISANKKKLPAGSSAALLQLHQHFIRFTGGSAVERTSFKSPAEIIDLLPRFTLKKKILGSLSCVPIGQCSWISSIFSIVKHTSPSVIIQSRPPGSFAV